MTSRNSKPAPLDTDPGTQMDDNIDDMGRRPDGSTEEQPVDPHPEPSTDKDKPDQDPRH